MTILKFSQTSLDVAKIYQLVSDFTRFFTQTMQTVTRIVRAYPDINADRIKNCT